MSQHIAVITLFPEMLASLDYGVVGRAIKAEKLCLSTWNPRDYSRENHQRVDDRPFGGGPGMVLMAQPLVDSIRAAKHAIGAAKVVYLSPQGKRLDQPTLWAHVDKPLILLAGRYEGIDQRVIEQHVDEEWSIGDYVLSGGEFAAMVVIDGIVRLIPDVLGDASSVHCDSFSHGLLEHPQYTRPRCFEGREVPEVLLSGDHSAIADWRQQQALRVTRQKRPDLLDNDQFVVDDKAT